MTYNLSQISEIVGAQLRASRQASATTQPQVELILTDSRSLTFADRTLFFALVTAKGDGHRYVASLYARGVRAFVTSRGVEEFRATCPEAWFLVVPDTLAALQALAAHRRAQYEGTVVGITGSNGKTIVKEWLYQLLHERMRIVRSPRSYNSQVGVPLSVWQMDGRSEMALIEAGISQAGEMERLERIVRPTIGVLTNVGTAHDAGFASRREKMVEKLRLFRSAEVLIYNADTPGIADAIELAGLTARSMAWTLHHKDAQVEVLGVHRTEAETSVRYVFMGLEGEFTIAMTDEASLENAMTCLAVMLYLGVRPDEVQQLMPRLAPLAMRLEVIEGQRGCLLINDAYNADLTSLEAALEFQRRRASQALSSSLVLSDLQQTGMDEAREARRVMELCRLYGLSRLVGIGPRMEAQADVFERMATEMELEIDLAFFASTADFLTSDLPGQMAGELILLKGARLFRFEQISEALQLRRHETILEVNLDAVVHNLDAYRARLRPETKLVCMVKAFGYGNGSYELAKTLQDRNVDYLAVAVADEGAELRRQGIRVPIIVMNPEFSAFRTLVEWRLEPEIYSFRLLDAFVAELGRMGVTHYPVHVKIDSGMHRLGFQPHEVEELVARLTAQTAVVPRSVFSHFAVADDPAQDAFTDEQARRFTLCADRLRSAFPHQILRHLCNSAGIERLPQYQFEMCRLGIGLYGFEASPTAMQLEPVATLRSTILQIKEVPATETVGYGRRGVLSRTSRIAMIPIGYADGYDRRLGNGHAAMLVLPRGAEPQRCPTVGNVCMDLTFLDVTDCPAVHEGDEVVIFGADLPLTELSTELGTIPYEVMTSISQRVKRVYYKE